MCLIGSSAESSVEKKKGKKEINQTTTDTEISHTIKLCDFRHC